MQSFVILYARRTVKVAWLLSALLRPFGKIEMEEAKPEKEIVPEPYHVIIDLRDHHDDFSWANAIIDMYRAGNNNGFILAWKNVNPDRFAEIKDQLERHVPGWRDRSVTLCVPPVTTWSMYPEEYASVITDAVLGNPVPQCSLWQTMVKFEGMNFRTVSNKMITANSHVRNLHDPLSDASMHRSAVNRHAVAVLRWLKTPSGTPANPQRTNAEIFDFNMVGPMRNAGTDPEGMMSDSRYSTTGFLMPTRTDTPRVRLGPKAAADRPPIVPPTERQPVPLPSYIQNQHPKAAPMKETTPFMPTTPKVPEPAETDDQRRIRELEAQLKRFQAQLDSKPSTPVTIRPAERVPESWGFGTTNDDVESVHSTTSTRGVQGNYIPKVPLIINRRPTSAAEVRKANAFGAVGDSNRIVVGNSEQDVHVPHWLPGPPAVAGYCPGNSGTESPSVVTMGNRLFRCTVCATDISGEDNVRLHVAGRKHINACEKAGVAVDV